LQRVECNSEGSQIGGDVCDDIRCAYRSASHTHCRFARSDQLPRVSSSGRLQRIAAVPMASSPARASRMSSHDFPARDKQRNREVRVVYDDGRQTFGPALIQIKLLSVDISTVRLGRGIGRSPTGASTRTSWNGDRKTGR
jgi:hypothetical protein